MLDRLRRLGLNLELHFGTVEAHIKFHEKVRLS
jgi:hypothetical protein